MTMRSLHPNCDACGGAPTIDMVGNFRGLFHGSCWRAILNGISIPWSITKATQVVRDGPTFSESLQRMEQVVRSHKWKKARPKLVQMEPVKKEAPKESKEFLDTLARLRAWEAGTQ